MNRIILIIILVLYFGNYHISNYFSIGNDELFWDIKCSIYQVLLFLALRYTCKNNLIESFLISSIFSNVLSLLVFKENYYSINDIIFVVVFLISANAKYIKGIIRKYKTYLSRSSNNHNNNKE